MQIVSHTLGEEINSIDPAQNHNDTTVLCVVFQGNVRSLLFGWPCGHN